MNAFNDNPDHPLYTNILQFNNKICYSNNLDGVNPMFEMRQIIGDILKYCI